MNIQKAEQSILNAIYATIAWLLLDLGLLFQEQGVQAISLLFSRPELAVGVIITVVCIAGLMYKSRLAAMVLLLLFLLPLVLRMVQGVYPSTVMLVFFLLLLYFFLSGVLGAFRYHHLKNLEQEAGDSIDC